MIVLLKRFSVLCCVMSQFEGTHYWLCILHVIVWYHSPKNVGCLTASATGRWSDSVNIECTKLKSRIPISIQWKGNLDGIMGGEAGPLVVFSYVRTVRSYRWCRKYA